MIRALFLILCLPAFLRADAPKPNIVLFLADDLGYSDIGCYGGEVETPNLDKLAAGGVRFTQFYNTARCWPSRAALLSGYYPQQIRRDALPTVPGGNAGARPSWARLLPEMLKPAGYASYHSGKWHVDRLPLAGGFDRSYSLNDHDRNFGPRNHTEDDKPLPQPKPEDNYYTTRYIADHAVKCLKDHAAKSADKPFFSYVAFTVPHFPLQALPEDVAKYKDRFRAGWDVLRKERQERMSKMGLMNCDLSPRTAGVPAWETLSAEEKDAWSMRMAVHAAMVDRMDQEIGKVLAQVRAMNAEQNTLVMFLSDNGASAEKILRGDGHDPKAAPGSAATYLCLEPGWANLANTPFRYSKIFVHEGGISTPFILNWPRAIAAKGELRTTPSHLVDIVPTLLELTGQTHPKELHGKPVPSLPGKSLLPAFARDLPIERDCIWWMHQGNKAVRVGDWKLVAEGGKGAWELYDLSKDRGESSDLASSMPSKVKELEAVWQGKVEQFTKETTSEPVPATPKAKKK